MNQEPKEPLNQDHSDAHQGKNLRKQANVYAKYSGMAIQMGVIIVIGAFAGQYLDKYLNLEKPLMTIIGSLFGVFIALYLSLKDLINPK